MMEELLIVLRIWLDIMIAHFIRLSEFGKYLVRPVSHSLRPFWTEPASSRGTRSCGSDVVVHDKEVPWASRV